MKPVIAIVGAGAVGGYYGGRLAQHGFDVHFLFRSDYQSIRTSGLVVHSLDGDFTLSPDQIHAYRDPIEMPKADLVIVTLKTTANSQLQPLIAPLLKEQTLILTLQNGLGNEERLAELFGADRILGGLAFVCINRLPNGVIQHMDHGQIKLGEFVGPPRPRTHQITQWLSSAGLRCQALEDLRYGRWEKLVWNVPFNGLGAVLNRSTDLLIATTDGRELVRQLMLEVMATAASLGVDLPPNLPDIKIEQTRSMGAYKTSMQIDRQLGRPMEIDAILHKPLLCAQAGCVPTHYMQMLYEMATLPEA